MINAVDKQKARIKCAKCETDINCNTHQRMTPCECGAISVDGCEDYFRVIGNKDDSVIINGGQEK